VTTHAVSVTVNCMNTSCNIKLNINISILSDSASLWV